MVQLAQPVDTGNGQTMNDYTPVPIGEYPIMMVSSEEKATKANDGSWYIQCDFIILDGEFKGRSLKTILNLGNKNPTTVEMAYKELNTIGQATGQLQVGNTDQFLNIPMIADVKHQGKAEDDYGIQNTIKNYMPMNNQAQQQGQAPAQQQATQQQPAQQMQQQPAQQAQQQMQQQQQQPAQQQGQAPAQQQAQQQATQQQAPAQATATGGSPW